MTKILAAFEKHGTRYFDVTSVEDLNTVALYLVRARCDDGYYDEPTIDRKIACAIISQDSASVAYRFLQCRSDKGYEYERIDVFDCEDVKALKALQEDKR